MSQLLAGQSWGILLDGWGNLPVLFILSLVAMLFLIRIGMPCKGLYQR